MVRSSRCRPTHPPAIRRPSSRCRSSVPDAFAGRRLERRSPSAATAPSGARSISTVHRVLKTGGPNSARMPDTTLRDASSDDAASPRLQLGEASPATSMSMATRAAIRERPVCMGARL
jgi:hypothetical protein